MGALSPWHPVLLLAIVLLVVGPGKKLPETGGGRRPDHSRVPRQPTGRITQVIWGCPGLTASMMDILSRPFWPMLDVPNSLTSARSTDGWASKSKSAKRHGAGSEANRSRLARRLASVTMQP
jgi:hypothetical protein